MQPETNEKHTHQVPRRRFKEVNAEIRALIKQEMSALSPEDIALVAKTRKQAAILTVISAVVFGAIIVISIFLYNSASSTPGGVYFLPPVLIGASGIWLTRNIFLFWQPERRMLPVARMRALEKASPELKAEVASYNSRCGVLALFIILLLAAMITAFFIYLENILG